MASTAIPSNDHFSHTAPPLPPSSFTARLLAAKKSIHEATEEALRSARSEETLSGVVLNDVGRSSDEQDNNNDENAEPNIIIKTNPYNNKEEEEEASFELGMSLFGDDVRVVERDLMERLERVEAELERVLLECRRSNDADGTKKGITSKNDDDDENNTEMMDNIMRTEEEDADAEAEAKRLSAKVQFLKQCSMARSLLDECSTAAIVTGRGKLVQAATFLSQANEALVEAEDGLIAAMSSSSSYGAAAAAAKSEVHLAKMILDSIKMQCRRKRVRLYTRTSSIINACIQLTKSSLTVKSGGSGASEGLADAYDALAVLSSKDTSLSSLSSSSPHNQNNNRLQNEIALLSKNIYDIILKPILTDFENECASGTDGKKQPASFHFTERTSADASSASSSSSSSSTSIKGPTTVLEWKKHEEEENPKKAIVDNTNTSNVEAWSEVLSFVRTIMTFIHEKIFLKRKSLCQIMGQVLFGGNNNGGGAAAHTTTTTTTTTTTSSSLSLSLTLLDDIMSSSSLHGKYYDGPLMKQLVNITWETCILSSPVVPSTDICSTLDSIKGMMRLHTDDFERDLLEKGFVLISAAATTLENKENANAMSVDGEEKQKDELVLPLSNLARNYERKYAEKRRSRILSNGRDLLLKNDYHNTVEVGVDVSSKMGNKGRSSNKNDPTDDDGMPVFLLHKSAVSKVASDLMALCRQTMDESVEVSKCSGSPTASPSLSILSPTLYRTARELLDLFRLIIPTAHGSEVSTIPRTAAVLHNDCVYFAHNMLTFGHEYKEKFVPAEDKTAVGSGNILRQMCTFVDLVLPFRELADRTMGGMIERQKLQILDIVGSRIGDLRLSLRSNEDVIEWSEAQTALTAGLYHVRHLSQAWRSILSEDVYGRAMGNLVDTLFSLYLDQVMKAPDISETATHFVSALFRDASRDAAELFDPESMESGVEIGRSQCGLWERFTAVGLFMDMSLADINLALAEGVFQSVTGPELSRLIKAVFDESEKRSMLLQALTSDSG